MFSILKPSTTEMRVMDFLKKSIKLMNKECVKFTRSVAAICCSKPTGVVDENIVRMSKALYNNIKITSVADKCNRPFKLLLHWKLLKDHPEFSYTGTIEDTY
ncbi:hypothetical protein BWQ96_01044 [Gracilariopsis chorda]|uniref:Uncharacterized protein n=1 Tax=Gracilariopsis chorda TaxID=448386 RepID=A0A2V3J3Y0_9FLOR|nr:hypothetical protein BWQ96_01044 [Gracilariopsis chorda]|eukprot:PXF49095.1 hypothetical protein BWQ96_01044 [Gracilariopsis chorda]